MINKTVKEFLLCLFLRHTQWLWSYYCLFIQALYLSMLRRPYNPSIKPKWAACGASTIPETMRGFLIALFYVWW